MGLMKVILKQDVDNLGEEGDVKEVKRGYARNFLFPNNLVLDFSKKNRIILEQRKAKIEQKRLLKKENANSLKEKLEQESISITITAGESGRLYGTITTSMIEEELKKLGYEITKKQIELKEHIKFGGNYKVKIHLYQTIYAEISLEVIAKKEEKKERRVRKNKKRHNNINNENEKLNENKENLDNSEELQDKVNEVNDNSDSDNTITDDVTDNATIE